MGLVRDPRDTRSGRRGTVGRNQAELFASVRQCERQGCVCVCMCTRACVCVCFKGLFSCTAQPPWSYFSYLNFEIILPFLVPSVG